MIKKISLYVAIFFCNIVLSQKVDYHVDLIPINLKENANSVVRNSTIEIEIVNIKSLRIKSKRVVTVFNSNGNENVNAYENYDKTKRIQNIEATIYNAFGIEIKSIKSRDFGDRIIAESYSGLTDDRIKYLKYTPTEYPYTVVFESEVKTSNTAFIPSWNPIANTDESIILSRFSIIYPNDLGFKFLEKNFEGSSISKEITTTQLTYKLELEVARRNEDFSVSYRKSVPYVNFGLNKFNLEGVEGQANNWEEFGSWMYNNLLADTEELSDETKNKVKLLVGNETDAIKKAKIIYEYVQNKTRYVSIQLGIGGWKPMLAKDVDRLGYGDCKALSNYTRVLLKAVNVESFYTIIFAGDKIDIEADFVSMQGNHVVLAIPDQGKYIFLECTSQTKPFGYEGRFTDDRKALIVKPLKSEVVSTTNFKEEVNTQFLSGNYEIDALGKLLASFKIESKGIQYDQLYEIEKQSKKEIETHYKNKFDEINNLLVLSFDYNNNKEEVKFTENVLFAADNFANVSKSEIIFVVNALNQSNYVPQRCRNRKNNFEISRGYLDQDEIEIKIPLDYKLSSLPENYVLESKYGKYSFEFFNTNNGLKYKRKILIKKGIYDKSEYDLFRKFREQISRYDHNKIVLIKK